MIDKPGSIVQRLRLYITGSVIVQADDVTIDDVIIVCRGGAKHDADGINAIGVNRLKLYNVEVRGCGRNGIFLQNGEGHDLAEGLVTRAGDTSIVFDAVQNSTLFEKNLRAP